MRADRLVAILLMLQRREQVTAAEVAEELEISERTAGRDLDALAMSGAPVYSQQGRGGGWRLAGGGRIDLSGLSADEARALFVLAGPQADVSPEVRSALRKLVRALPESMRTGAETAARSLVVDPDARGRGLAPNLGMRFDVRRNWELVSRLVADGEARVQYIFVAPPIRQLLLDEGRRVKAPTGVLERAARVMVRPSEKHLHGNHFHVRIYCAPGDRPKCQDVAPFWPWYPGEPPTSAPNRAG